MPLFDEIVDRKIAWSVYFGVYLMQEEEEVSVFVSLPLIQVPPLHMSIVLFT